MVTIVTKMITIAMVHKPLKNTYKCCCIIETSSVPPRKSSEIFGNIRKISEKCSETFALPSEQFWKIFGNLRKVVGNLRKIVKYVVISMFM